MSMVVGQIATFLVWTLGVAALTCLICKRTMAKSSSASEEYFSGGHALSWYIVAGSLMLTNLSTEQLVGLNGSIFKDGCLAGTAWETFAALAMCVTASVFLPRYMKCGLATTTGFLGNRFDLTTRTIVSSVFLVFYTVGFCPPVLYTGALGMRNIFQLDIPLWMMSTCIGFIGACYAIFGGLKAVAVSDCLNGVGLLAVGIWVPVAAMQKIGGLSGLFSEADFLRPLVSESDVFDEGTGTRSLDAPSVPWHVTLSGLMLMNLYYWSTNQVIVQRALAARSLAEGQKGILFAASLKVVGFVMLCLPGVIGAILAKKGILVNGEPFTVTKSDTVYPLLVRAVMPDWSLGFFAAVLLGSILSTFNSALNSASTLFGLEIYKIYINPEASDDRVVKVASWFGIVVALISLVIAPYLEHVGSIFEWLQRPKTIASLPIITAFIVGIATATPDAFCAKVGFVVGATTYLGGQFLDEPHFLHVYFICCLLSMGSMFFAAYCQPFRRLFGKGPPVPVVDPDASVVDLVSWRWLYPVIASIVALVVVLTSALQAGSRELFLVFLCGWAVSTAMLVALPSFRAKSSKEAAGDIGADANSEAEASSEGSHTLRDAAAKEATTPGGTGQEANV